MPDDSLRQIERRVQEDRQALASALDALTDATSADALRAQSADLIDQFGTRAFEAAKANPAAVALIGAGAALLLAQLGKRQEPSLDTARPATAVPPDEAMDGFDERLSAADQDIRARATGTSDATADQMRVALYKGLERLPEPARRKIVDLRLKAIAAQEKIEKRARKTVRKAAGIVEKRPYESAALTFAVGAVAAALLPSTRIEDRHLGQTRDMAIRAARDAFHAETAQLSERVRPSDPGEAGPRPATAASRHPR